MNENSNIKQLLQKFVLNQCSPLEIAEVVAYCRANTMTSDFPTMETVKNLMHEIPEMDAVSADRIFSNILETATSEQPIAITRTSYRKYIAIAASIVVLLSVGISYKQGLFSPRQGPLILKGNEITLQMANGDIKVISENGHITLTDADGTIVGNQSGNKIAYDTDASVEKLAYNTLKIPYGKRFQVQLSDGTLVHLNSGTTLKYPVKFLAGERNRQVFLDGEAFFDVSKDKTHPFVVNADKLNVRVLGTHFNVSNYPEDDLTDVVLIEGSVGLYTQNEEFDALRSTILKPGYKGSLDKSDGRIDTRVVDPEVYISWMKGQLTFKNMTFKNISKKLERHYNVVIVNQNPKLDIEKFNASFNDESIVNVLSYFNEIHSFNYTIEGNKILIK